MSDYSSLIQSCRKMKIENAPASPHSDVIVVERTDNKLVLQVSGDASHCLDDIGPNNWALYVDWNQTKVISAVKLANEPPLHALPDWMIGDYPITKEQLMLSLMRNIGAAGSGSTVGMSLAAPNSLEQLVHAFVQIDNLKLFDPFLMHICGPERCRPLGKIFLLADGQLKTTALAFPFPPCPPGCGGVDAF